MFNEWVDQDSAGREEQWIQVRYNDGKAERIQIPEPSLIFMAIKSNGLHIVSQDKLHEAQTVEDDSD